MEFQQVLGKILDIALWAVVDYEQVSRSPTEPDGIDPQHSPVDLQQPLQDSQDRPVEFHTV